MHDVAKIVPKVLNDVSVTRTSANAIAHYFKKKGIEKDSICHMDLMPFYHEMNPTANTALHFSGISVNQIGSGQTSTNRVWPVIVETREHPLLEFVVCQFANNLKTQIQIFHGTANEKFITDSAIGNLIQNGQVYLTSLGVSQLTIQQYNALLLNPAFWQSVYGRDKILIFQTDTVLCANSPYRLAGFKKFDYIGSKWDRNRHVGIVIDGGNGGLSLRSWDLSIECLQRFPPEYWPGGEDSFYAFHFDLLGANVARENDCAKFSTQRFFSDKSFGAHKVSYLDESTLQQFLQYCPEAQCMLNYP